MAPHFTLEGVIGEAPNTPADLRQFLNANSASAVTLSINSPGGDAYAGAAMMAAVEGHGGVTVHVRGIAASAATLPVVAAQKVVIHHAALLMIHEPAALADGPADTHRMAADALDKMSGVYAAAYAKHTGHSVDRILAWMRAETWMTAEEAVELRFADQIEALTAPMMLAAFDYTRFRSAPVALVQATHKNGWAAGSPDSKSKGKQDA
ncbi:Clp protease ClpP [Fertoebacter nigrum]|uniref:Clp protease ClpP n=1 Tax=Fertoeibacter niger TaxID=2656921 RepID=A0A8X8GZZ6_9RHOB|nr:head maturation protease, ClpP-related [Fertoeibacter niger]NUB43649.1 Clp protease ClpP [Fertoeibacter niger]